MTKIEEQILIEWHKAHAAAESNSSLMILASKVDAETCTKITDLCGIKMDVLLHVDSMLYSININDSHPESLRRHILTERNKSNCGCRFSSMMRDKHPECITKSKEWFDSYNKLMNHIKIYFT